jgi:hypothetical protein
MLCSKIRGREDFARQNNARAILSKIIITLYVGHCNNRFVALPKPISGKTNWLALC